MLRNTKYVTNETRILAQPDVLTIDLDCKFGDVQCTDMRRQSVDVGYKSTAVDFSTMRDINARDATFANVEVGAVLANFRYVAFVVGVAINRTVGFCSVIEGHKRHPNHGPTTLDHESEPIVCSQPGHPPDPVGQ